MHSLTYFAVQTHSVTVHPESIHSISLVPHCVMLQPCSKVDWIHFSPQNSLRSTP